MTPTRILAALALFTLLVGCEIAQPLPFEIVIENADLEVRYLQSADDSPWLTFEALHGDDWSAVAGTRWGLCVRRCGQVGGAVGCTHPAMAQPDIYALLPGDTMSRSFTYEEAWVYDWDATGRCARQVDLAGPLRVTVCHAAEASLDDEVPPDGPETSGVVGDGDGELEDPICDEFEFDVQEADEQVVVPVAE